MRLQAARDNERRARSLGFPIFRLRLTAFVISGAIAGVAGYLAAAQYGYVAPQMLGWHVSATILVMVLIGGLRSVAGPLVGALVLLGLEEVLKSSTEYWKLIEGLVVIGIVLMLPDGMRHLLTSRFRNRRRTQRRGRRRRGKTCLTPPQALRCRQSLCRRTSAACARSANVSIDVHTDEIHAVIGPNGAGKSTLINLLSGDLHVSGGSDQPRRTRRDTPAVRASRPSRDRPLIPEDDDLSRIPLCTRTFGWPRRRMRNRRCACSAVCTAMRPSTGAAHEALERTGLMPRRMTPANKLSHGEQRQLEIAMVLATTPRIILLDEPLAGMGLQEARRIVELVASLRKGHAVLLVEHDMDAVFELADRLTVMQDGRVIATGSPNEVRRDPAVRAAYLGTHGDAA